MKKQKGFTLIELLVVIAIIGLLSTLAVVALNSARMKARDAKRVSDVKQMQTALELYYNDNNGYPSAVTSTIGSFMTVIPTNPQPPDYSDAITDCQTSAASSTYVYDPIGSSPYTDYTIKYCLGGKTGSIEPGKHTATSAGLANP
jgi:type II secretion system protein G